MVCVIIHICHHTHTNIKPSLYYLPADDDFLAFMEENVILGFDIGLGRFTVGTPVITIEIEDDDIVEGEEEFTLNLMLGIILSGRDIVIRSPNVSRVIIEDNDGKNDGKHSDVNTSSSHFLCSKSIHDWIHTRCLQCIRGRWIC